MAKGRLISFEKGTALVGVLKDCYRLVKLYTSYVFINIRVL